MLGRIRILASNEKGIIVLNEDLISKATRSAFREALVPFVLREITMFFEDADLSPDEHHDPQVSGMRRGLVEQYYSRIDFTSQGDVGKLLFAYKEIIMQLDQQDPVKAQDLLRRMKADGYDFDGESFVPVPSKQAPLIETIRSLAEALDLEGLNIEVSRLERAAEEDPPLAVGTAKEMVETVCKTILEERMGCSLKEDLPTLVRTTAKELALLPDNIPSNAKGSDVIRRLLSNLNQVAQGLAELRNLYGTGHGHEGRFVGIQPRHARLAVGAATTLSLFLLETHLDRSLRYPSHS